MGIWAFIGSFSGLVVALLIAGIILIVVEMFQPGIGIPGATGLICLVAAVIIQSEDIAQALIMVAMLVVIIGILFLIFVRSFFKGRLAKSTLMLNEQGETPHERYAGYVGKQGVALTMLRPVGTGKFDDEMLEVTSGTQYIDKGAAIEITETDGIRILVREIGV